MGAWGTGLYQNDFAADLKADFADWVAVSPTLDAAIETLRSRAGADAEPVDADSSAFWLVLADLLHAHGLEHPDVFGRVHRMIDDGLDLRFLEELEMSPGDLRARAKVLEKLKEKWSVPPKRVKKIPVLKQEPFIMTAGGIYTYPAMDGNARYEPLGSIAKARYRFEPDAENAFLCLNTARVHFDTEARYFVIPLALMYEHGPVTLEDCREASFVIACNLYMRSFEPLGGWTSMSRKDFRLIGATLLGEVTPDLDAFAGLFGDRVHEPQGRYGDVSQPLMFNQGYRSETVRGHIWAEFGELPPTLGQCLKA